MSCSVADAVAMCTPPLRLGCIRRKHTVYINVDRIACTPYTCQEGSAIVVSRRNAVIVEPKATPARRSRRSQRDGESGRVPLNRELVLARAIEVGDQEGLETVSFRRLASDMNVTP